MPRSRTEDTGETVDSGVGRILVWRGPRTEVPKAPRGEAPRGVGCGEGVSPSPENF